MEYAILPIAVILGRYTNGAEDRVIKVSEDYEISIDIGSISRILKTLTKNQQNQTP
jgi:hypothetical protein